MKYKLTAKVTISIYTEVEAESLDEAIEIASNRDIEKADFSNEFRNEHWVSDEYDGEPFDIKEQ